MVIRSVAAQTATGIFAANATVWLGQSTLTENGFSWAGNTVQSFGDNYIAGNGDGTPAPAIIARK